MCSASETRKGLLAATLVAAVVLGVGAGQAQASSVTVTSASKAVRAGKTGKLSLRLSAPSSMSCKLSLARFGAARKNGKRSSRQITVERSRLGWSWRVPSNSRSGRVRVSASCSDDESGSSKTVARTFRIIGKRAGTNTPGRTLRGRASGSLLKPSSGPTPVVERPSGGFCEEWVRYKRPDLADFDSVASGWDDEAARKGFTVDTSPRVGDAAVYNVGVQGVGPNGHVAYVEEVAADGTLRLSEFNAIYDRPYEFSDRYGQSAEGLVFIHKK